MVYHTFKMTICQAWVHENSEKKSTGAVSCVSIYKGWMEVDSFEEYQQAWAKLRQ